MKNILVLDDKVADKLVATLRALDISIWGVVDTQVFESVEEILERGRKKEKEDMDG